MMLRNLSFLLVICWTYSAEGVENFPKQWLTRKGKFVEEYQPNSIEVAKSPLCSEEAYARLKIMAWKILQMVPEEVWNNLVKNKARIGVASRKETLCFFPEYRHHLDTPACENSCSGECKITCTADGRKYCTGVFGLGGIRAAVDEDNILCTEHGYTHERYFNQNNLMAHELGHTIMGYGLPASQKEAVKAAYSNAKSQELWDLKSYAMSNSAEYWGEATNTWFATTRAEYAGGMNGYPHKLCLTEADCRKIIQSRDPQLAAVLNYAFPKPGGLTICPGGSCVDRRDRCGGWAESGECAKNPGFMLWHCMKSCNVCESGSSSSNGRCENKVKGSRCSTWANMGECHRNPVYMVPKCAKSCGQCWD